MFRNVKYVDYEVQIRKNYSEYGVERKAIKIDEEVIDLLDTFITNMTLLDKNVVFYGNTNIHGDVSNFYLEDIQRRKFGKYNCYFSIKGLHIYDGCISVNTKVLCFVNKTQEFVEMSIYEALNYLNEQLRLGNFDNSVE